jgi:hypothetical protein
MRLRLWKEDGMDSVKTRNEKTRKRENERTNGRTNERTDERWHGRAGQDREVRAGATIIMIIIMITLQG